MPIIVAIDGPAGAGKSTVARRIAARLGLDRVDTGAIYRTVTLAMQRAGITDETEVVARLADLDLRFEGGRVWLAGEDVTEAIRTRQVTGDVSRIAAMRGVRSQLLGLQRKLGLSCDKGAVLEGRDIGTVVFPEADVKIFLTASASERARRRVKDLSQAGTTADLEEVLAAIEARDRRDSEREAAPLRQAADAIRLDTDGKTEDQVVDELVALIRTRLEI